MSNTLKNLLLLLGVVTVCYAGYYLYNLRTSTTLDTGMGSAEYESMLARTQVFIQRSQELSALQLDFSVLESPTFNNLESYERPLEDINAGRSNPFAETAAGG